MAQVLITTCDQCQCRIKNSNIPWHDIEYRSGEIQGTTGRLRLYKEETNMIFCHACSELIRHELDVLIQNLIEKIKGI